MKAVLIHGLGGCSLDWSPAAELSSVDATAIDMPFHGGRPLDRPVSFKGLVDDVVDCLPQGEIALAGFSLGASVALACAAQHSDRVRSLLLVAGVWPTSGQPTSAMSLRKLGRIAERHGLAFAWNVVRAVPPICGWDADDKEEYRGRFLRFDERAFAAALSKLPSQRPTLDLGLVRGKVRTTVLGWHGDRVHPASTSVELARRLDAALMIEAVRPKCRKAEAALLAANLDRAFRC